jgi:hypothetical protein
MAGMLQQPLFIVSNQHIAECGTPPSINPDTDARYVSYFHWDIDQWIFMYDRQTNRATLQGGDVGW